MIEFLTSTLQMTSVILTSALGLASTLFDFKDINGQITAAGRRLLAGLVGSSIISISSTGLEQYSQDQKEAAALSRAMLTIERSNLLLMEVNRGLHPLESAGGGAVVLLEDKGRSTEIQQFKQRMKGLLARQKSDAKLPGVSISTKGGQLVVDITSAARGLYPTAGSYPFLHTLCTKTAMTVWLQRPPASQPMAFRLAPKSLLYSATHADLRLDFEAAEPSVGLRYSAETNELTANVDFKTSTRGEWDSNGRYASTLDIPGSACLLLLDIYDYAEQGIRYVPKVVKLTFSGETFWLYEKDLTLQDPGSVRVARATLHKEVLK